MSSGCWCPCSRLPWVWRSRWPPQWHSLRLRAPAGRSLAPEGFSSSRMGVICKDAWTQAIEAFARAGGTVIAGARTGTRDANSHVIRDTAPGRALPAPCGVEVQEFGLMPSSADGADIEGVPVGVERRTEPVHGTGALRVAAQGWAVTKPASAPAWSPAGWARQSFLRATTMGLHQSDLGYRCPPERKSRHSRIVHELGIRIVAGGYKPGGKMPQEARLCANYSVRRAALRGVMPVLVAKGLVISRQGAGAIVRERIDWHLLDPDVLYWMIQSRPAQEFVETLMTMRRIFEPATAALAAKVASAQALEKIAQAFAGMEAASTPQELLEPDLAFHRSIAQATGNDLVAYIANMLSLALSESIKLSSKHPNTHALSLPPHKALLTTLLNLNPPPIPPPRHKAILTALVNRDPLAARQATLVQLDETHGDIARILDSGIDLA